VFQQELARRGVLFLVGYNICHALSDADVEHTLAAVEETLTLIARAMEDGRLATLLDGLPVEPILRRPWASTPRARSPGRLRCRYQDGRGAPCALPPAPPSRARACAHPRTHPRPAPAPASRTRGTRAARPRTSRSARRRSSRPWRGRRRRGTR